MDVLMPQLGETVAEGKIVKWFVQAGDVIKPGDNLFEIETDKTSMEVPATFGGTLSDIHFSVGETAKVGAAVATIAVEGEAAAPKQAPAGKPVAIAPHTPPVTPAQIGTPVVPAKSGTQSNKIKEEPGPRFRGDERKNDGSQATRDFSYPNMTLDNEVRSPARNYGPARIAGGSYVTPLARRLASERGIDLTRIAGSGPHGRIVAGDVDKAPPATDRAPVSSQFYLVADVEIDRLNVLRKEAGFSGAEFSIADFAVKAWAAALRRVTPDAGTTISLMHGSKTSIIGDAADKSLTAIVREAGDTSSPNSGAKTAVQVLSTPGIREFNAVVAPPFTAILAVGAARRAPIEAADGRVKFVSVMTVTLSCDPHAFDSALAAELLAAFKNFVEMPVTALV